MDLAAIRVLSIDTVNKIAAGEVVERPASVVKELVENALDAGATNVTVEIQKGGIAFIRVTDNGCGIAADEAETAFLPHSTSKITAIEDLENLYTMGFRGEALASIASVSKVDLLTKPKDEIAGCALSLESGKVISNQEAGCPDGTTIVVRELFYNTPARMKFMKKDVTEAAHVTEILEKLIIGRPDVSFRLINNGRETLFSPGTGALSDAVSCVFGNEIASKCAKVAYTYEGVEVTGLVGQSAIARPNRAMQFFYVNGRCVKSKTAVFGAEEAYRTMMMVGKFPVLFLHIQVPAAQIDVNVHPQKAEVKFSNERLIHDAIFWAVQNALFSAQKDQEVSRHTKVTSTFGGTASQPSEKTTPIKQESAFHAGQAQFSSEAKTERKPGAFSPTRPAPAQFTKEMEALYQTPQVEHENEETSQEPVWEVAEDETAFVVSKPQQVEAEETEKGASFRIIGQAFDTYILFEQEEKLFLVDQHAAHERIKYEEIVENAGVVSQTLMLPETVKLTPVESRLLQENKEVFEAFGFQIEEFGNTDFIVREAPLALSVDQIEDTVVQLLELIGAHKDPSQIYDKGYFMIACKSAIKANHKLSTTEMESLVRLVLENDRIRTCPHGRPVIISFTKTFIEKEFKRIVS